MKTLVGLALVLCGTAAGCAMDTAESRAVLEDETGESADAIEAGRYYELVALHSLKCVDVANASVAHAAPVVQAMCWGGGNQKWKFKRLRTGVYEIVVQHSGKCLDVANASLAHAAPVVQADCWGGSNQHWTLRRAGASGGEDFYEIIAEHSGKCLDVANLSLAHAAPLVQAKCWGGGNQRFILRPVEP
jgi:hypothetical protein